MANQEDLLRNYQNLPDNERRSFVENAANNLTDADKKIISDALAPTQWVANFVWIMIVGAFAAVFVGVFFVIGYGLLSTTKENYDINDKLITIFTTVSAFLGGLLAPSPVGKK